MSEEGFIKLNRKIMRWEWYRDVNTAHLFIHCLLHANHQDASWQGILIKRGSFITSLQKLADETGLTLRQTRTALKHLTKTQELTKCSSSKNTLIIVNNYDKYQSSDKAGDKQTKKHQQYKRHDERQTDDKEATTNKNEKKYSPPLREENTSHEPGRPDGAGPGSDGKTVTVAEIRRFADTVYGGDAYNACDFRRAFINSGTKFPTDWKDIFTRFAAADSERQDQFLADVEAGKYLEKWGAAD